MEPEEVSFWVVHPSACAYAHECPGRGIPKRLSLDF